MRMSGTLHRAATGARGYSLATQQRLGCHVSGVPVLRFVGVWKGFVRGRGRIGVLEDVSLEVGVGEVAAVMASREQGKTTLIRLASGTLGADRGRVLLDGRDMTGISDRQLSGVLARTVGIATRAGPDAALNVHDYLEMRLNATREFSARERRQRIRSTLAGFGLDGVDELMWEELSNWQRVLVEFAQAVICKPRLLLIDDILDGLELGSKEAALRLIEGFARDMNCGVLMAVSDRATAINADRIWHLSSGKLRQMHPNPNIISLRERREVRAAGQ
jgi:ABC-type multidrug transport system ATPase subunit